MITGQVTADRDPIILLCVLDRQGRQHERPAVVDSGFNGWLTLPAALIADLRLPWRRLGRAELADGSETLFDVYSGEVIWDGKRLSIPIDESQSEPLVGMQLMDGYELRIQAVVGGAVVLQRMELTAS